MILDSRKLQPMAFKYFIRLLDLCKIVIRDTKKRNIVFSFEVLCQFLCPLRSIPDVMDPVNIEMIQFHQLQLHLDHIRHGSRRRSICTLRSEFIRNQIGFSRKAF